MDGVVPIDLARYFSPADIARGEQWMRWSNVSGFADTAVDVAVLLFATFSRPGRRLWDWCTVWSRHGTCGVVDRVLGPDWRAGAVFLMLVTLARNVATAPFVLWRGYFAAHSVGLSHESFTSFTATQAFGLGTALATNAVIGATIGAVRQRWPRYWWLAIGGAASLALVGDAVVEPLRAQVDTHVRPLPDGMTRQRLEAFLREHQAHVGAIMVAETSKKGTFANAYVTGLGPTRRLVLTDTLLSFGDDAVLGAVAHEVGHRREERLPLRLAMSALATVGLLWLVELAFRLAARRGITSEAAAFPFVRAMSLIVLLLVGPIHAAAARREEREADTVELQSRRDYDAYVAEQVKLVRTNAMDPSPPAWLQLQLDHPSPEERIGRALWYKERMAGTR